MRRREFIRLLGGTAAWPLVANAQDQRVRRIGILTAVDETENKVRIDPLLQELPRLGWTEGRNVRTDMRAAGGNADVLRKYATELVALTPDVLVAFAAPHGPSASVYPHCAHRVHNRHGSTGLWFCQQPRAAKWQRHRLHVVRI
ncbi:MAG: hypothetical protein WA665_16350 [Pseudolabrys sp.]